MMTAFSEFLFRTIPNFQKGGLCRISTFFRGWVGGGGVGYIKKKLEYLKWLPTKKVYNKTFFSVITKNLNWENLTKNLVTLKRGDGVKDKKF